LLRCFPSFLAFSRLCLTPVSSLSFFFHAPFPTDIYTLSLHDALPIYPSSGSKVTHENIPIEKAFVFDFFILSRSSLNDEKIKYKDRKSTRLNSSHVSISYAVFCLKKKKKKKNTVIQDTREQTTDDIRY